MFAYTQGLFSLEYRQNERQYVILMVFLLNIKHKRAIKITKSISFRWTESRDMRLCACLDFSPRGVHVHMKRPLCFYFVQGHGGNHATEN